MERTVEGPAIIEGPAKVEVVSASEDAIVFRFSRFVYVLPTGETVTLEDGEER